MKKTSAKKTTAVKRPKAPKKSTAAKKAKASMKTAAAPRLGKPLLKQPQSKQQAAVHAGIFLHTDDAWASAYFDPNDLHFLDRQLFG